MRSLRHDVPIDTFGPVDMLPWYPMTIARAGVALSVLYDVQYLNAELPGNAPRLINAWYG